MALPIIVVHRSDNSYLDICLRQARRSNPQSRVILIGDERNSKLEAEHYLCSDFATGADAFAQVYEHLSSNPTDFELFCFQRWFIIAEFMRAQGMGSAFVWDSDVLLFSDVTALQVDYAETSLAYARNSGHVMFVMDRIALEHFCSYVMRAYTDGESAAGLRSAFADYKTKNSTGGICDMTLLCHYRRAYPETVGIMPTIAGDEVFDNNINSMDGFTSCGAVKNIAFDGERPFGVRCGTGEKVYFHALHFQGPAKGLMQSVFDKDTDAFRREAVKLGKKRRKRITIASLARQVPGLPAARRWVVSALRSRP